MTDTNLIAQAIAAAIDAMGNQKAIHSDWPAAIRDIFTVVTPLLLGLLVWWQKRNDTKLTQASLATAETAKVVAEIKTDVNSERSTMIEKLEVMNNAFVDVVKENATLREFKRAGEVANLTAASAITAAEKRGPNIEMGEIRDMLRKMLENEIDIMNLKHVKVNSDPQNTGKEPV